MRNNYYLGIDIGGTKCAIILGDEKPKILYREEFPTMIDEEPMKNIDKMLSISNRMIERKGIKTSHVKGIGISCGGPLDTNTGMILSPPNLPGWNDFPIVDIVQKSMGIATYMQNDANACVLAESFWGAGKGCKNIIFLTFGTGLGAGIVLNGQLYTGTNGLAGEIGHIRLSENGPVGHGKEGSFEGFCSGGGISQLAKQMAMKRIQKGETTVFGNAFHINGNISAQEVVSAALAGDSDAQEILRISGHYLGKGLSILIDLLNPEKIIIGSIYVRGRRFIEPYTLDIISKETLKLSSAVCSIEPTALGEKIGDYGCLCVAMHKYSKIY